MILLRILVFECMIHNIRLSVKYIETFKNILADALSRQDFKRFWENAPEYTQGEPDEIPAALWPIDKIWKHSNQ